MEEASLPHQTYDTILSEFGSLRRTFLLVLGSSDMLEIENRDAFSASKRAGVVDTSQTDIALLQLKRRHL